MSVRAFLPQPQADSWGCPPRSAGALLGRRLRDRAQNEAVEPDGGIEAQLAAQSRIDDRCDSRNGQRRFRDVRGQHDFSTVARGEDGVLLLRWQISV